MPRRYGRGVRSGRPVPSRLSPGSAPNGRRSRSGGTATDNRHDWSARFSRPGYRPAPMDATELERLAAHIPSPLTADTVGRPGAAGSLAGSVEAPVSEPEGVGVMLRRHRRRARSPTTKDPDMATKQETIETHRTHESDTGSPEVQIALLSSRISHLTQHLQDAPQGSPQPARPADAGRPAAADARLRAFDRRRPLPRDRRQARPPSLNLSGVDTRRDPGSEWVWLDRCGPARSASGLSTCR